MREFTKALVFILFSNISLSFDTLVDNKDLYFLRWDNNDQSLLKDSKRGLGGGIEYQISKDFCKRITPLFIKSTSCSELQKEFDIGLSNWEKTHPLIKFNKLPDSFSPHIHPQIMAFLKKDQKDLGLIKSEFIDDNFLDKKALHGAEIDFFPITDIIEKRIKFFAYADLIWSNEHPRDSLGNFNQKNSYKLLSVDIFFNDDPKICYAKNEDFNLVEKLPSRCKSIKPFSFVVAHEVGHALALDHIKESYTIMGAADDFEPIYTVQEVDDYHLRRLYPLTESDLKIRNSFEDEFLHDDEPDY